MKSTPREASDFQKSNQLGRFLELPGSNIFMLRQLWIMSVEALNVAHFLHVYHGGHGECTVLCTLLCTLFFSLFVSSLFVQTKQKKNTRSRLQNPLDSPTLGDHIRVIGLESEPASSETVLAKSWERPGLDFKTSWIFQAPAIM